MAAIAKQEWAPHVNVIVKDGVAELYGYITDDRERQGLIVAAENVAGVKKVHDHLVWVEPMSGVAFPFQSAQRPERAGKRREETGE